MVAPSRTLTSGDAVVNLTAEPKTVLELDRQLGLNEQILRTKVIRPSK